MGREVNVLHVSLFLSTAVHDVNPAQHAPFPLFSAMFPSVTNNKLCCGRRGSSVVSASDLEPEG